MTNRVLVLIVVLVILVVNAGVSFAIVEWRQDTVEGPQGERGERGPAGLTGAQGIPGESAATDPFALDADGAIIRLTQLWALDRISQENPGDSVSTGDPQVRACLLYITNGENSAAECGYRRAE